MSRAAPTSTGPKREVHSADLATRALPPIEDPADREGEVILSEENALNGNDYLDALAFMEEEVVVILHRGREKFSPTHEQFGVNGKIIWIECGQPTRIKRKYLEVIARSQPIDIRTEAGEDKGDAITFNRIERSMHANFSFSVVGDTNPRGADWLMKLMRET